MALVLAAFMLITVPIYRRVRNQDGMTGDAQQMRRIYTAWALYSSDHNDQPAPSLRPVRYQLLDDRQFVSALDPFADASGSRFPIEPLLPSWGEPSTVRISYAYLLNFAKAGKIKIPVWAEAEQDRKLGLLTSVWHGNPEPSGQPFQAHLSGPYLRINTDGSVFTLISPRHPDAFGNADDLFTVR